MSDLISRQTAIDAVNSGRVKEDGMHLWRCERNETLDAVVELLEAVPPVQPEITEEQAIEHLQSTGWMQRHDRILTESTWDIIRCRDCKYCKDITSIHGECECGEM